MPRADFLAYLLSMNEAELREIVREYIEDNFHELMEAEELCGATADTNAFGWGVDEFDIDQVGVMEDGCYVTLFYSASGGQSPDQVYHRDRIGGTAEARIVFGVDGGVEVTFTDTVAGVEGGED